MVHAVVICLRVCAVYDCKCARTFCSSALSGLPSLNPRMGSFFTSTAAQGKVLKLHRETHIRIDRCTLSEDGHIRSNRDPPHTLY